MIFQKIKSEMQKTNWEILPNKDGKYSNNKDWRSWGEMIDIKILEQGFNLRVTEITFVKRDMCIHTHTKKNMYFLALTKKTPWVRQTSLPHFAGKTMKLYLSRYR